MSKVLIITTSIRARSNSDIVADKVAEGARAAGHDVEVVSLKGKTIFHASRRIPQSRPQEVLLRQFFRGPFTPGCARSQQPQRCAHYQQGQQATLLDRLNPLFPSDYKFRNVYMISTAAEDEDYVYEKAVSGLNGWVDCFSKAEFKGSFFLGGVTSMAEASGREEELKDAYEFGKALA